MGRIYDALKKAEEERIAVTRPDASAGVVKQEAERATGLVPLSSPSSKSVGGPLTSDAEPPRRQSGLLKMLTDRCPQSSWSPDPGMMLIFDEEFHGSGSEEFRSLRSRLTLVRKRQALKTLLVTSALPGEGKSFVALNLAQVIFWQREHNVLLIDADLRSSCLHLALGASATPGLSDYLSGDADEFAIVQRGPFDNFFFVAGGKPTPRASELLAKGGLKTLVERLAGAFDWIVIDSPPVIPVSDAKLIAEVSDGVLIVVRAGMTPVEMAKRACGEFRGKPFAGVVLNSAATGVSYYQYRYERQAVTARSNGKGHRNSA